MAVIKKKIWPGQFDTVASGKEKFQLRLADFDIGEGDTLVLEEWNPQTGQYTGRTMEKKVNSVLKFRPDELPFYSKDKVDQYGLQIISLE